MISEIRSSENETDGGSFKLGRCGNGREKDTAEGTFQGEQCYFSTCFGFESSSGDISLTICSLWFTSFSVVWLHEGRRRMTDRRVNITSVYWSDPSANIDSFLSKTAGIMQFPSSVMQALCRKDSCLPSMPAFFFFIMNCFCNGWS